MVSASFTDPASNDKHPSCSIAWGDATTAGTVTESGGNGKCTGSHSYKTSGKYNIVVTVTDDNGGAGQSPPIAITVQ